LTRAWSRWVGQGSTPGQLWTSIAGGVLVMEASLQMMELDAYAFLTRVLRACRNRPLILVDEGL